MNMATEKHGEFDKSTPQGLRQKNIEQWSKHCELLLARGEENLTEAEREDVVFRQLQIKRWLAEEKAAAGE